MLAGQCGIDLHDLSWMQIREPGELLVELAVEEASEQLAADFVMTEPSVIAASRSYSSRVRSNTSR